MIPRLDYNRTLFSDSKIPLSRIRKVLPKQPYELYGVKNDRTPVIADYAIEVDGVLHYVYDVRHGHNYDVHDTTAFSNPSTDYVTVLTYDYGSVLSVKELLVVIGTWSTTGGYATYVRISISTDGTTYTPIAEVSSTPISETIHVVKSLNLSFRYLIFELRTASTVSTANCRIRKIVIIK